MSSLCRVVNGLMEREVDGEVLLLDTESNLIHQLNKTASLIWRKCQEGTSSGEIAESLAESFDVEEDKVRADVERTIDQFTVLRIIKEVPELERKANEGRGEQE